MFTAENFTSVCWQKENLKISIDRSLQQAFKDLLWCGKKQNGLSIRLSKKLKNFNLINLRINIEHRG
jgi:hypothetical protein